MLLKQIDLSDYRNYARKSISFSPSVTVIVGKNASGKTNILEATAMLSSGNSFQAQKIEEMVRWDAEVGHVIGIIDDNSSKIKVQTSKLKTKELQVTVTRGMVLGRRVSKRRYQVNGVPRRKQDFVGNLYVTTFRPQDLRMIEGSPKRRRDYFDDVLVQVDSEYRRSLSHYERGLRRRNKVLTAVREGETKVTALAFWDQLLIKEGTQLFEKRRALAEFINERKVLEGKRRFMYKSSLITEKRMQTYRSREIAAGHTLIGPHKDDFLVMDYSERERDLSIYGSRGEQRLAVLWLKLVQLDYIHECVGRRPLLLLDDIFSELDDDHDALVMSLLDKQQTILTTTEKPANLSGGIEIQL